MITVVYADACNAGAKVVSRLVKPKRIDFLSKYLSKMINLSKAKRGVYVLKDVKSLSLTGVDQKKEAATLSFSLSPS